MTFVGASILLLVIVAVLCAPPRWALIGAMAGVLFLTQGQQLQVFGFNLYAVRFVELAGFIRVVAWHEVSFASLNSIDKALLLFYSYYSLVSLFRAPTGATNDIGITTDAFLCYFTFRGLVQSVADLRWFLRAFLILLGPFAALVIFESRTQHNLFSSMGGVTPEELMRHGRLRCQGSFRHPILMGTVGSSFFPLYIALAARKGRRLIAAIGICLCLILVWASNSGGPAGCILVGIFGWMLWRWRTRMRLMRRILVTMVVLLTLAMKAPVWYIFARASRITGGGGWHRSYLIDTALHHLNEWWLVGMPGKDTVNWFPYFLAHTGGADLTNAFVCFGVASGVGGIALFIALLVCSYRQLGNALARIRALPETSSPAEFMLWGLGVMITVHISNWFDISYFDQIYAIWFMQLAAIASLSDQYTQRMSLQQSTDTETRSDIPLGGRTCVIPDRLVNVATSGA